MTTAYTVQELAQLYAEALVEYHGALYSNVCDGKHWRQKARDDRSAAQSALDEACERQAHMNSA